DILLVPIPRLTRYLVFLYTHLAYDHNPVSLYCYRAPQVLHSFPTRRSSDLEYVLLKPPTVTVRSAMSPTVARLVWRLPSYTRCRSEEHTSELQSPDQLVCRLLLEKRTPLDWLIHQDGCINWSGFLKLSTHDM